MFHVKHPGRGYGAFAVVWSMASARAAGATSVRVAGVTSIRVAAMASVRAAGATSVSGFVKYGEHPGRRKRGGYTSWRYIIVWCSWLSCGYFTEKN